MKGETLVTKESQGEEEPWEVGGDASREVESEKEVESQGFEQGHPRRKIKPPK